MTVTKKKTKKKKKKTVVKKQPRVKKLKGSVTGEMNGFPIMRVRVQDLKEATYNPRSISESALAGLKTSVHEFGMPQPIIHNKRTGNLVGGHQRMKTLDPDGTTDVVVVDLSPEREKALNLALNNPKIQGEWTSQLGQILEEISEKMPQVAKELKFGDLTKDFENLSFGDLEEEDTSNLAVPEAEDPPEDPISKEGEVYQLGPHRLMCGDSTNPDHVAKLMNGEAAKLLATDPPYLVDYRGSTVRPGEKEQNEKRGDWDRFKGDASSVEFFVDWLKACLPHCSERIPVYQWHAFYRSHLVRAAWDEVGLLSHCQIVWVKPGGVLGRCDFMWRHEPCTYGWVKGSRPTKGRRPPNNANTVWDDIGSGPKNSFHLTSKPVEIFARPIRWHLNKGEICLEPFGGSGSCLIAAAMEKRVCYAMEINPAFVDVIRKRWGDFARANKIDPGNDAL